MLDYTASTYKIPKKVFYCSCVQSILKYAMKYPLKFIIYCRSEFYTKCTTDFSQFQRLPQKVQLLGSLRSARAQVCSFKTNPLISVCPVEL